MDKTKTNAMRILDKAGIPYNTYTYDHSDGLIDGISVAVKIGRPVEPVTGYIRGGCSPIGMKKEYTTVMDSSCKSLNTFIISAGKIGCKLN